MPAQESFVIQPVEGVVTTIGPFEVRSRVLGSQTGGAFEIYDLIMGPGTIDYHVHNLMDETLLVVEGEVEFIIGTEKKAGPTGSVAFVKRGVHHGFTNHGPGKARVLVHFNPAHNQEEYFKQLRVLLSVPTPDGKAVAELQAKFDQTLVPLP